MSKKNKGDETFASLLGKQRKQRQKRESFASLLKGGNAAPEVATEITGDFDDDAPVTDRTPAQPQPTPLEVAETARYTTRVAVFENGPSNQKRAVDVIDALGYTAQDTRRDAGRLRSLFAGSEAPEVVLVGLPGGESQIAALRQVEPPPLIVASLPGPAASARQRATEIGADLFLVRPHARDNLASVLGAAEQLAQARAAVAILTASERDLRDRLSHFGQPDADTGFHQFEFFQRMLVLEIKRAKRYNYPLAAVLVAFDEIEYELTPVAQRKLRQRIASAITANIRDIDLPVEHADGRVLIFLPYTDLEGATEVGNRVVAAVRAFGRIESEGGEVAATASVGISAVQPGTGISFAKLMRDANQALRAAQLKGGDRVVVRT